MGRVEDVPSDRCVAVADGAAVVVAVDGQVVAFANRCLHQASELAGGRVFGGALTCPKHFWRFRLPEGTHTGGRGVLPSYPTDVTESGEVYLQLPDPEPALSMREMLLAHAREWTRGDS